MQNPIVTVKNTVSVGFDSLPYNDLSMLSCAEIINIAADYLNATRFFNSSIDNFTNYEFVGIDWENREVVFPIILEA